jgi:pimeloyl-ACP methyl ester carboxylesterase
MIAMLEEFASDVSGGSIADCAHWLAEERPNEITDAILAFLAR